MTAFESPQPLTQAEAEFQAQAQALLRRHLIVTAFGIGVVLLAIAFVQTQGSSPRPTSPVDVYVQAHKPRDAGSLRLAYVQLFVAAAVALMAIGHTARVVAFFFRRKVS